MSDNNTKAIILAAGMGTRLRPFTNDRPKCLVEINGQSLLDSQLKTLRANSISDITVIGGYKGHMLKNKETELIVNEQYETTNMVYSLFCAKSKLNGECLISYGDIVYSNDILESLLASTDDISIVIDKNWQAYWEARFSNPLDDAETLTLSNGNTITEIGKKPRSIKEINGQYIGLMKFSSKGISQLNELYRTLLAKGECMGKTIESAYMTDIIQEAINAGYSVKAVPIFSEWIEVDSVSDLQNETTLSRHDVIIQREVNKTP